MRSTSIFTLWASIKQLLSSFRTYVLEDAKKMKALEREYLIRKQAKEQTNMRDDEDILGI